MGSWQRIIPSAAGDAGEKCHPRTSGRSPRSWSSHWTGAVTDVVPRVSVARVKFFAESLTLQTPVDSFQRELQEADRWKGIKFGGGLF